jgi:predicted protein tyrosine phosphatase
MNTIIVPQTKTASLLELTAPYDNPYQGDTARVLFVCSVGLLRSPTAAAYFSGQGYNTRSCGSSVGMALIPISANLIEWAHQIVFMRYENKRETLALFQESDTVRDAIERKSVVFGIEDDFNYMQPELISELESCKHKLISVSRS